MKNNLRQPQNYALLPRLCFTDNMQLLFEPSKWYGCNRSDLKDCDENANCYSYVLNRPDYYWAVPGMGFAKTTTRHFLQSATKIFEAFPSDEKFKNAIIDGAIKDGLSLLGMEPEMRVGYYLTALFISEESGSRDFHWYRQDDDRTWSHKDGQNTPSNQDSAGNIIYDPRRIEHPSYPVFGGFFLAPQRGITLQQNFPLI